MTCYNVSWSCRNIQQNQSGPFELNFCQTEFIAPYYASVGCTTKYSIYQSINNPCSLTSCHHSSCKVVTTYILITKLLWKHNSSYRCIFMEKNVLFCIQKALLAVFNMMSYLIAVLTKK